METPAPTTRNVIAPTIIPAVVGPLRPMQPVQQDYYSNDMKIKEWSMDPTAVQLQAEQYLEDPTQCKEGLYPAFVLSNGLLLPRCGKENWISQAEMPTEQDLKNIKDKYTLALLNEIAMTTQIHGVPHQYYLHCSIMEMGWHEMFLGKIIESFETRSIGQIQFGCIYIFITICRCIG